MLCINESDRGAGVRDAAKFHIKIIADAQFPVVVSTGRVVATIVAFGIVLPIAIELLGVRGASPWAVRIQERAPFSLVSQCELTTKPSLSSVYMSHPRPS